MKIRRIIIVTLLVVVLAAGTALLQSAFALDDPFAELPVVFAASVARGTGDGSTAENAIGNDADYDALRADTSVTGGVIASSGAWKKNALYKAYEKIRSTGGTVVVCGKLTVDSADRIHELSNGNVVKSISPTEFSIPGGASSNRFKLTSVYNGVDYRETNGAKIVIDQENCTTVGLNFRSPHLIDGIVFDYKYSDGTYWYGTRSNSGHKTPTVFLQFNGYTSEIGEDVTVISSPSASAVVGCFPSLIAGGRYTDSISNTDLTVKSGNWYMVIAGSHGMNGNNRGNVTGTARVNVQGGKITYLLGDTGLDPNHNKFTDSKGKYVITVGENATVNNADGSPYKNNASDKSISYDVNALSGSNIKNFETVEPFNTAHEPDTGEFELHEGSSRVYFIRDVPSDYSGYGNGLSADDPFVPLTDPEGFDPDAQYPKYHLTTAFYQAIQMLQVDGGTIVICGPVVLGNMQAYGSGANTKDVMTPNFKAPIKFTSVYNGVDYRETNGAKLVIREGAEIGVNGESIWENIDIVTGNTDRVICFNNNRAIVGDGVRCYPEDDGFKGVAPFYVSLAAGHRYDKLVGPAQTNLIVRSGTYNKIVGGAWGTVTANWADKDGDPTAQLKFYKYAYQDVTTNLTLGVSTRVLGEICGTNPKAQPFGGHANITINGGYYECDIDGAGFTSFLNPDASVYITVNGGDFTNCWSVNPIALNPKGYAPASATLDCRNFPEMMGYSLKAMYGVITDFAPSRVLLPDWFDPEKEYEPFGPETVDGDANGDWKVTALDIVRLKKYLAVKGELTYGLQVAISISADANGDGVIDSLDVVRLKRYFAEYDPVAGNSPVKLGKAE